MLLYITMLCYRMLCYIAISVLDPEASLLCLLLLRFGQSSLHRRYSEMTRQCSVAATIGGTKYNITVRCCSAWVLSKECDEFWATK
ncbi:uncharacterized protein LOC144807659 isoform X2 [Lissotriton helveticus]